MQTSLSLSGQQQQQELLWEIHGSAIPKRKRWATSFTSKLLTVPAVGKNTS